MELQKFVLALEICLLLSLGNGLRCNETEYSILGENVTLDCLIEGFGSVYWFNQKTSFENTLVKIEKGKKEILDQHYDITDDGDLLIKNVTEELYDVYKIVSVNPDSTYEEATVTLQAAIKPQQDCPKISFCDSCSCIADTTQFHNVSCSILGARPLVNLKLVTEDERTFEVAFKYDANKDAFDTIAFMEYSPQDCGSTLQVSCVVTGENMFDIANSYMTLHSEPCILSTVETTTTEVYEDRMFSGRLLIIIICAMVFILVSVVALLFFILCRRCRSDETAANYTSTSNKESDPETNLTDLLLDKTSKEAKNPRSSDKGFGIEMGSAQSRLENPSKDKIEDLMKHLQDRYQTMGHIKPLPWGDEVLIDKLYTGTMCSVIHPQCKSREEIDIKSLFTSDKANKMKRVLFLAEFGHGKTTLRKYLACSWSKRDVKERMEEILFILPLKGIDINRGIGEQIHHTLPQNMGITYGELCYLLFKRKCHVLLDGLDELQWQPKTKSETTISVNDITVRRLLNESMLNQYPMLRLWVTSRQLDEATCLYRKPYVEVQMLGFDTDQISEYIDKTLTYYKRIEPRITSQTNKEACDRSDEKHAEIRQRIQSLLDGNDLIDDLKNHPLLMAMFIHILASKLYGIKNQAFPDININKLSSLICAIMQCLEKRYLDKSNSQCTKEKLASICIKLGKASLIEEFSDSGKVDIPEEDLNIAKKVGYIIPARRLQTCDLKDHNIEFFHEYAQEYCIAKYIESRGETERLNDILQNVKSETSDENLKVSRILLLMCRTLRMGDDILKSLVNSRHWNTLADCIYESEDDGSIQNILYTKDIDWKSVKPLTILQGINDGKMKIVGLDKRYHQNSLKLFMVKCRKSRVRFHSMSFGRECPLDYMFNLQLPDLNILKLRKFELTVEQFLKIVMWTMNLKINTAIRFVKCRIPDIIEDDRLKQTKVSFKIIREDVVNLNETTDKVLDIQSGTWKDDTILTSVVQTLKNI